MTHFWNQPQVANVGTAGVFFCFVFFKVAFVFCAFFFSLSSTNIISSFLNEFGGAIKVRLQI